FILAGILGLEAAHIWLSIPFTCIYIVTYTGNCTILFVIGSDTSLHKPMYQFLSMLTITNLGLSLSTTPTVMSVFWVNYRENSFNACFAQLYFVHSFSFMEPSVLLAMVFHHCVAICHLLRYSSVLTNARIGRIGLAALCRCLSGMLPSLFVLRRLPVCQSYVFSCSYLLHQELIKLECADITFSSMYGLAVVIFIVVLDPLLTVLSYIMTCKRVVSITSQKECLKALNNCLSHILAVLILHIPMLGLSMVHWYGKHASSLVHTIMANINLLVSPVLNPIIYSIETKQICRGILKV
uniref:Olfactory receptor family 51 subfamily Q member 1 (gene/pseudogene) n=1 Tax=Accipiter nisus TaxID=211598 RepID=A0A8B9ML65_9AVES